MSPQLSVSDAMNSKLLAIGLAALVVTVGGAAAVGSTIADDDASELDTREAAIDATYDNGTVTATVTNGGDPIENATVEVGDEEYTTDANGTVTADVADEDEIEVSFETDSIEGKSEYAIVDGELVLQEEEFEYEAEDDGADDDDEDEDAEDEDEEAEDEDEEAEDEAEDDDAEEDEETDDEETEESDDDDEESDDGDEESDDDEQTDDGA